MSTNRAQFQEQLQRVQGVLYELLVEEGMPEAEARVLSQDQINSMGSIKTMRGECHMGGTNPMACMFCDFGHMADCHYPLTCEEAECSHYQQEMEDEGQDYYPEGVL